MDVAGKIGDSFTIGKGQYLTAIKRSSPAQGITVQFDRSIGLKEVPVKNELGVVVGKEFVEETQEEIVGSPESPKIEGYIHVSQQTRSVSLGTRPGTEKGFSLKNIRANNLALGVENESGFVSYLI